MLFRSIRFWSKSISEAYHKAKADGSNPELVKAVEELLGKPNAVTPNVEAFGSEYEVPLKCSNPDCKKTFKVTWDLKNIQLSTPPQEYEEELIEHGHITITLPVSEIKVIITVPSYSREKEINKNLKNKKEKTKSTKDFFSTGRLIAVIKEMIDKEGTSYKTSEEILNFMKVGVS